jgi:hypothetical protein
MATRRCARRSTATSSTPRSDEAWPQLATCAGVPGRWASTVASAASAARRSTSPRTCARISVNTPTGGGCPMKRALLLRARPDPGTGGHGTDQLVDVRSGGLVRAGPRGAVRAGW